MSKKGIILATTVASVILVSGCSVRPQPTPGTVSMKSSSPTAYKYRSANRSDYIQLASYHKKSVKKSSKKKKGKKAKKKGDKCSVNKCKGHTCKAHGN